MDKIGIVLNFITNVCFVGKGSNFHLLKEEQLMDSFHMLADPSSNTDIEHSQHI